MDGGISWWSVTPASHPTAQIHVGAGNIEKHNHYGGRVLNLVSYEVSYQVRDIILPNHFEPNQPPRF